ncbi:MAG: hypothetical protein WC565_10150, partial [Parcubacteria group bacterium]
PIFSVDRLTQFPREWRAAIQIEHRDKTDGPRWYITIMNVETGPLICVSVEKLGIKSVDDALPLQKHINRIATDRIPNQWDHLLRDY